MKKGQRKKQMAAASQVVEYAESLASLVRAGLNATELSGIQDLLKTIVREFGAFGGALWECYPDSILTPQVRKGGFFALAQWFENGKTWRQHDIPVESATGYAIANSVPSYVISNILEDENSYHAEFLKENDILRACVIPIRYMDNALGALNVFRTSRQDPFTDVEEQRLRQMAGLLPALYERVRDKVAYRCSRDVNDLLQRSVIAESSESKGRTLYSIADQFCSLLKENLGCFDVSIYLEEGEKPETYLLHGSTLPDRSVTTSFFKNGETGPTAAALTYGRCIEILDLRQSSTFPKDIPVSDPNPKYVEYMQREVRSRGDFPLSFISTPILAGDRLLGALRCCAPIAGPMYFARREATLLQLLAGQIGHFVSNERRRSEVTREREAYKITIESITKITELVYSELGKSKPDEDCVLQQGLDAIAEALPGEQWIGIGIRESSGRYSRKNIRALPKADPPKGYFDLPATWQKEFDSGKGILKDRSQLESSENKPYTVSLPVLPNSVLLAPVQCRDQFLLLEIANTGLGEFPKHAIAIATLLGKQLGVYHDLLTTIGQLKLAQVELQDKIKSEKRLANAHAQSMMDLEHQIRTPLRQARIRLPALLRLAGSGGTQALVKPLQYLRGNLRRAGRVAGNARLFSRLALGQKIECSWSSWTYDEIKQLLIEAAMDNMLITDERETKGITFGVDEESFAKIGGDGRVKLDKDLLDQAVNDLLDNAGKYSDANTRVRIEASLTKAYFIVIVTNKGLKISPDQVPVIKQRGERGPIARLAVGEGNGIGLWITDEIMKAHGGTLDIIPTTPDRITRIRLMFPTGRS